VVVVPAVVVVVSAAVVVVVSAVVPHALIIRARTLKSVNQRNRDIDFLLRVATDGRLRTVLAGIVPCMSRAAIWPI
jgi:hypothetical protein